MKTTQRAEFGDFQTPEGLAREVCDLVAEKSEPPDVIVEPTCGVGAFLCAAAARFPHATLRGWEINPDYVEITRTALLAHRSGAAAPVVTRRDFFESDWDAELAALPGRLLVIGNPPWVTNSAVSALNGSNVPLKENFMGLRGMAAKTGKSNFDISEWMIMRLLSALRTRDAVQIGHGAQGSPPCLTKRCTHRERRALQDRRRASLRRSRGRLSAARSHGSQRAE